MKDETTKRKGEHVRIVSEKGAQYKKTTGLEKYDLIHCALPEMDISEIDLSCRIMGREFNIPLMITGMTGGYPQAREINIKLAKACEKYGMPFGLGSQRQMIESGDKSTYDVKDDCPDVFLIGNIGGVQLKQYGSEKIIDMCESVRADAVAVHLNPLQEAVQPEGDTDFSGILNSISDLCKYATIPVIVKETGAGITGNVAKDLKSAGVSAVDISGAGGTSWSKVEYLRGGKIEGFEEWGNPTAYCIESCRGILPIIASGGIRSGVDAAKCIALGAVMCGAAYPFIKNIHDVESIIEKWASQIRMCAFLTGSKNLYEIRGKIRRI